MLFRDEAVCSPANPPHRASKWWNQKSWLHRWVLRVVRPLPSRRQPSPADWPDVLWYASQDGTCHYISPNASRVLGYPPEEILRQGQGFWQRTIHPDDLPQVKAWGRQLWAQDEPVDFEYRFRRRDGRLIWLHGRAHRKRAADGTYQSQSILRDVTGRRQAEQAHALQRMMLATASHEIRTPMTAIMGYADLLLTAGQTTELERQRWTQTIASSGKRLLELLDDLLDHTKIEEGRMPTTPTRFSPHELADDVLDLFRPALSGKGLTAAVHTAGDIPEFVLADAAKVRQILNNLVSNAIKFTACGGVTIDLRRAGDMLSFSVIDTGVGIGDEERPRLFEPFRQLQAGGLSQQPGTGLGLSISRGLARLMGGDLTCHRNDSAGSTFTATIAYHPADEPSYRQVIAPPHALAA